MTKVIGVRFRTAGKIYYFDPTRFEIKKGDHVIVETARGVEYGTVVGGIREVDDSKVVQPLKPVLRIATERDNEQEAANKGKEKEAFRICQEKIRKHGLDMKLIDAEYPEVQAYESGIGVERLFLCEYVSRSFFIEQ